MAGWAIRRSRTSTSMPTTPVAFRSTTSRAFRAISTGHSSRLLCRGRASPLSTWRGPAARRLPGAGWAIDDLEYETDPPPYVPPVVTPPVVTPPAGSPLLITGMGSAAPVVAGRAALLTAAVVGQAPAARVGRHRRRQDRRLLPGEPDDARPQRGAGDWRAGAVTVKAFDSAGASTAFAQKFAVAAGAGRSTGECRAPARPGRLCQDAAGLHLPAGPGRRLVKVRTRPAGGQHRVPEGARRDSGARTRRSAPAAFW